MVLKSAGKSKLKKKTEFRRQETEEEPDPRYWILDAGCWTPLEKTNKRAERVFSRRAAVNAE